MTSGAEEDVLAGVLLQLASHTEQINDLCTRQDRRHDQTASRIEAITTILGRHATIVDALGGLDRQVAVLARDIAQLTEAAQADVSAYQPQPVPAWWHLAARERESATGRLRAWVEQIYQPSYGHLAAALPSCWDRHPLCLFTLDWLSELWSVLYLSPHRSASTLAAQAEWHTRLLPAAAAQMTREAAHCEHGPSGYRRPPLQRPMPRRDSHE